MAFFTRKNTKKVNEVEEEVVVDPIFATTIEVSNHVSSISESQAMMIPIFKNGVEVITNSIAQLPVQLLIKKQYNNIELIENDKRLNVLNKRSNAYMTAFLMKKAIVKDLVLHGHAFLYKKESALYVLDAQNMQVNHYTDDDVTVSNTKFVFNNSKGTHIFEEDEIIHLKNGTKGVLYDGVETLQTALEQQLYNKNIIKNGALPVGLLKAGTRLTEKAIKNLRSSWENLYSGGSKAGKTILLEEGLEYQPLSLKPDELGLDKSASRINSDIAKLLNIPLSMLEESANKYGSVSTKNLLFLQTTIAPVLKIIEETFNNAFLYEHEENKGYEFRFNTQELLRGTNEEQADLALKLFEKGAISYHEMRAMLELTYDDSTDYHKDSIGSVYKYADGTILNLNTLNDDKKDTDSNKVNTIDDTENVDSIEEKEVA